MKELEPCSCGATPKHILFIHRGDNTATPWTGVVECACERRIFCHDFGRGCLLERTVNYWNHSIESMRDRHPWRPKSEPWDDQSYVN